MSQPSAHSSAALRIGFFGGSFDPPHLGHLAVARAAQTALSLDTVYFAPVGAQPLKPGGSSASFEDRVAMTELAIAGDPGFLLSTADAPKPAGRPNYTVETLSTLRSQMPPGSELFCLMGADSFNGLRFWYRCAEIPFVATLVVASRPGESLREIETALPEGLRLEPGSPLLFKAGTAPSLQSYLLRNPAGASAPFYLLPDLDVEISATQIREQLRCDLSAQELLPEAVTAYIGTHGLYR